MTCSVVITKRAEKSLRKVPEQVARNFFTWKGQVEEEGIEVIRKLPGYHDEPLQGKLNGYVRSARLGRGYRVYYSVQAGKLKCIIVEEVNHHDYKEIERLFGL